MFLLPFNHPDEPTPRENSWKFFIVCDDKDGEKSKFIDQIEALGENRAGDFTKMLKYLTRLASYGKPWEAVIQDKRKMHYVGEFVLHHTDGKAESEKVWEFKHGDIRILWCYGGKGKIILFGCVLLKDQKKIDKADVEYVGKLKNSYQMAYEKGQVIVAGDKTNEQTFGKFFPKSQGKSKV